MTKGGLTDRELNTVLDARRSWQKGDIGDCDLHGLASNGGAFAPLDRAEIDDLCERLNLGTVDGRR